MSKIKNGGLDQYGAGRFERQQFGTAGVEGVNCAESVSSIFVDRYIETLFQVTLTVQFET